ncbi:hypothetical protein K1719_043295 [Acacia pycnantha]|nr:hypothetical protein K1719_043295 [Acacia pycnantha]
MEREGVDLFLEGVDDWAGAAVSVDGVLASEMVVTGQEGSNDDLKDEPRLDPDSASEWDEFGDSDYHKSEEELDPGSWRPIFLENWGTLRRSLSLIGFLYGMGLMREKNKAEKNYTKISGFFFPLVDKHFLFISYPHACKLST